MKSNWIENKPIGVEGTFSNFLESITILVEFIYCLPALQTYAVLYPKSTRFQNFSYNQSVCSVIRWIFVKATITILMLIDWHSVLASVYVHGNGNYVEWNKMNSSEIFMVGWLLARGTSALGFRPIRKIE